MIDHTESDVLTLAQRAQRQVSIAFPVKKGLLFLGDVVFLNLALLVALTIRHLSLPSFEAGSLQLITYNALHALWLLIFYGVGLYDIERFPIPGTLGKRVIQGVGSAGLVSIVLFYTLPFLKIQPKTILLLDLAVASLLLLAWRVLFMRWSRNGRKMKILLCGKGSEGDQLAGFLGHTSHLGYEISNPLVFRENENVSPASRIFNRLRQDHVDIVAITRSLSEDTNTRGLFYRLLCSGIHVIEVSHLSEELTGKIPVSVINEGWFVENLYEFNKRGFEIFKRFVDITAAALLGVPTLLLFPLVALIIKLDSRGPMLFRQKRMGKGGRVFEIVKFRTMVHDAEREGAQWAVAGDPRITRVGNFLRKTRIDELPQLWNVLKGEMSFVGPRPERPEFVEELAQNIPFYETRHLVKPGLTGWAQINFSYGASVEDAREKLQYELYYIKNRSVPLDLSILIKTLATVLRFEGR